MVYTPSVQWLLDAARVYPVNVDPSVSTSRTTDYIVDTYVIENGAAGSAAYKSPFIYAVKQPDGRDIDTYLRIDKKAFSYSSGIANIPKYSYIEAAALNFFLAPTVDSSRTETAGKDLKITPLKQSWSQTTVTYASGKKLSSGSTTTIKRKTNSAGRKYYSLDVTKGIIEAFNTYWTTGSLTDTYGWRIESNNAMERLWSGNAGYNGAYGASTDRPYIWIRYKPLQLDVDLFTQSSGWTCGPACSVMMLEYLGVDVETKLDDRLEELKIKGATEYPLDIKFYLAAGKTISVEEKEDGTKKYSHVSRVMTATEYQTNINRYLNGNTSSSNPYPYSYHGKGDYISQNDFIKRVYKSLREGYPVMVLIKVMDGLTPFGYARGTDGHYVVITGIPQEDGVTKFIYNDPRGDSWSTDDEDIENNGDQRKIEASILYKHMKYYQYCAYSQA